MTLKTNNAGTKEWLEATKGLKITAYIEDIELSHGIIASPFTKEQFENSLRKVSRRIKSSEPDSSK